MSAEECERMIAATDFMDGIETVREGLEAAEAGRSKPASEVIREWEAL
jgi:predicted transcriptional regulator